MMANPASLQAVIYGRVQGVFFRDFVVGCARELGLAGYVINLTNGVVKVMAKGEREQLDRLVDRIKVGPPAARVAEVVTKWGDYTGDYSGFVVRH